MVAPLGSSSAYVELWVCEGHAHVVCSELRKYPCRLQSGLYRPKTWHFCSQAVLAPRKVNS